MFVLPLARAPRARSAVVSPSFDRLVERLFDDSYERHVRAGDAPASARTPAMDVSESDAAYTITFEVPGATREQLKVSVEGRRVTLATAAVASEAPAEGGPQSAAASPPADRVLYRERHAPVFARTVSLPAEVDQPSSQAKFDNGVLTLVLAKRVASGATELKIA